MTKRIRGIEFKTVTAAFLLLVGVFVILGAYDLGRQSGEAIGKNAANSYQYSQHADELIAGCLSLAERTAIPVCVREVIESTNEQQRAEADLVAQTQMGLWSLGMLIMSTFMFLVTAVGVWWIRDTLVETRRAVKAADDAVSVTREIGQAQSRAYITFSGHSLKLELTPVFGPNPQGQKGSVDIVISGKVKNSGQTPAWNVGALAQIGVAPKGTNADMTQLFAPREFAGTALEFGAQDERTYDIPLYVKADIQKVKNGSHIIWGGIQMKYTDIFNITVRTRIMSFYIKGIDVDDPTLVWDVLIKEDGEENQGEIQPTHHAPLGAFDTYGRSRSERITAAVAGTPYRSVELTTISGTLKHEPSTRHPFPAILVMVRRIERRVSMSGILFAVIVIALPAAFGAHLLVPGQTPD